MVHTVSALIVITQGSLPLLTVQQNPVIRQDIEGRCGDDTALIALD